MDCPTCGESFDSEHAVKIHHSKAHGESIAGVEVECDVCGHAYRVPPSRAATHDRKFCSAECKSEGYTDRVSLVCDHCGAEFERKRSLADSERHFCSNECKGKAYRTKETVSCANCGTDVERYVADIDRYKNLYCSRDCTHAHLRGAAHPNWKGGSGIAVAVRRYLAGETWRSVRDRVHASRDGRCRMCGASSSSNGRRLQVHHIVPVMAGGSHHRENLMLLCHRCHRKVDTYTERVLDYSLAGLVAE